MKRIHPYLCLLAAVFLAAQLFHSCRKADLAERITNVTELSAFHTIEVNGVYDIYLVQDNAFYVSVTGYPDELEKTEVTVSDSTLDIRTGHAGQFLHPRRENMTMYIHVDHLRRINIHEGCRIMTSGPLGYTNDEIGVVSDTKLAELDLELDCKTFYYWNNPNGTKMKLRGQVQELKLWNSGLGQVDASALDAVYVLCENGSLGDCRVRASSQLDYSISNQGNIYYYGNPPLIGAVGPEEGGKLIKGD